MSPSMIASPKRTQLLAMLACLAAVVGLAGTVLAQKKSDAVVKVQATAEKPGADGKQVVTITLSVDPTYHIYANPVGNEDLSEASTVVSFSKVKPEDVKIEYPAGTLIKDKDVGDYKTYEEKVTIKAHVQRAKGDTSPLEVSVKFQACTSKTCLLPATVKINVP